MADSGRSLSDAGRLLALRATGLLDTGPEESFDRFTRIASELLRVPVSLISLVDDDRQFFKSQSGLSEPWATARQTPLTHSFCQHVVARAEVLVIDEARSHPLVRGNLAVSELSVAAYLGVPLTTQRGHVLGAFCAIDELPRTWTDQEVGIMRDLAAAVMTEIELRRVSMRALENLRELNQREQSRDQMVHMLVHDLRTPLSAVAANLEALAILDTSSRARQEVVDDARRACLGLTEMIDEILTVHRAESTELPLDSRTMDARSLVDAAIDDVVQIAAAGGVSLKVEVPAFQIRGDAGLLRRVLANLLSNALANTPSGGSVSVTAAPAPSGIEQGTLFCVADTGIGIDPEDLERIFGKFVQVDAGRRRSQSSSGLGLAFCRSVVEQHGGRIWAESAAKLGARFYFVLPVAPPEHRSAGPNEA